VKQNSKQNSVVKRQSKKYCIVCDRTATEEPTFIFKCYQNIEYTTVQYTHTQLCAHMHT